MRAQLAETHFPDLDSVVVSMHRVFLSHGNGAAAMQIFFADHSTANYFFEPKDRDHEVCGFSLDTGDFIVYEAVRCP